MANSASINLAQEQRRILSKQLASEGREDEEEVSKLRKMKRRKEISDMEEKWKSFFCQ